MTEIIPKHHDDNGDTSGQNDLYRFGYFELGNLRHRRTQEDALAWHVLTESELTPTDASTRLTPRELGHRLWTSHQLLDKPKLQHGSTASTTVYDGQGNLITATLADAVTFAVVYGKKGEALGVIRLNAVTHKPTNDDEHQRITNAGGFIKNGRVNGRLAVSRAIGDSSLKASGVCSESHIDITNVKKIAEDLHMDLKNIGFMQIISTCDGFTDGARAAQTKKGHEDYLLGILQKMKSPGALSPENLSKALALQAKADDSKDNISVAIQTLTQDTPAFLLGMYDGHGGKETSRYAADNIGRVFKEQCALSPAAYNAQDLSVKKKSASYKRDNPENNPVPVLNRNGLISFLPSSQEIENSAAAIVEKLLTLTRDYQDNLNLDVGERAQKESIREILLHLQTILTNEADRPQGKIKSFYTFLDQSSDDTSTHKNIDVIKRDDSIYAANFLKGIAIIAATVVTGIIPGLIIAAIVYKTTGRQPFDFFKTNSERFEKEVDLIKEKNPSYAAFFRSDISADETQNGDQNQAPKFNSQ